MTFEQRVIDRLARIETKLENWEKEQNRRTVMLAALVTAGVNLAMHFWH